MHLEPYYLNIIFFTNLISTSSHTLSFSNFLPITPLTLFHFIINQQHKSFHKPSSNNTLGLHLFHLKSIKNSSKATTIFNWNLSPSFQSYCSSHMKNQDQEASLYIINQLLVLWWIKINIEITQDHHPWFSAIWSWWPKL